MARLAIGLLAAGLIIPGSAFAADTTAATAAKPAAPKRATAADVTATLSSKPGTIAGASAKAAAAAKPADAAHPDAKVERRIVEGQVVTVSKRAISVEYAATASESSEMLLPFGAGVTVEGVKALTDLKRGDRVKVGIEQTYTENAKGERNVLKTEALVVALVQRAPETLSGAEGTAAP